MNYIDGLSLFPLLVADIMPSAVTRCDGRLQNNGEEERNVPSALAASYMASHAPATAGCCRG